jgi:hypothetical protein
LIRVLAYLLVLVTLNTGFSQTPYFITLNKSRGLPNNTTYDILQDQKGFIWIACNEGLVRYDGNEYKIYTSKDQTSLAGSSLMEDKYGRIWMQNFDGNLYYVEKGTLHALQQSESLDYFTQGIVNDELFLRTKSGFDVFDLASLHLKRKINLNWDRFTHSVVSHKLFYFINQNQVFTINKKGAVERIAALPKTNLLWQFSTFNGRLYLVERENGEFVYQLQGDAFVPFAKLDIEAQILGVECFENEVWILTTMGAYAYDFEGKRVKNAVFKDRKISSIFKDDQSNYWFTTLLDGIFLVPDMQREILPIGSFKPLKMIRSDNGFIVGSKNHHLLQLTQSFEVSSILYQGNENADVYYVYQNPTDKTIFFSSNGCNILFADNATKPVDIQLALKEICMVDEKYYAFAASGLAGLFLNPLAPKSAKSPWDRLFKKHQQHALYAGLLSEIRAKSVVYNPRNKSIYFASNQGFFQVNSSGQKREIFWEGRRVYVQKIEFYQGKLVVLTTTGSLLELKSNNELFSLENKLNIKGIQIKQIKGCGKKLIFRTNSNLYIASEIKGKWNVILHDVNLTNFDVYDIEKQNNELILVTNQGILKLKSSNKKELNQIPRLHINHIEVNDSTFNDVSQLQLTHDQNKILVHFSVLNFGKVWKNQLFYRINQGAWIPISKDERELKFASLSPGNYTISFSWNGRGRYVFDEKITFNIAEPFYKQYWFLISSLLLIVGIITLYYRWQVRLLNKKNRLLTEKIELEKNLSKSILTSIKAQMNPHFFYNALNTIQSYIFINDKRNASSYLAKFSKLTRMILQMSDKESISIADEIKALTLYLELEKMRFEEGFDFEINLDASVDAELNKIPSMLIQPYVENAIKHGLLHKEGHKTLNIQFQRIGEMLLVDVIDNGVGRKKSESLQKIKADKHQSFSTEANQKRLEILNQGTEVKVSVEILDLFEGQIPTGTWVKLKITLQ